LGQPGGFAVQLLTEKGAVGLNLQRVVTDMLCQVEVFEGCCAAAALASGDTGTHPLGRRPVRHEPAMRPGHQPTKASRSWRSRVSSQTKSSGSGDSQLMRSPVSG